MAKFQIMTTSTRRGKRLSCPIVDSLNIQSLHDDWWEIYESLGDGIGNFVALVPDRLTALRLKDALEYQQVSDMSIHDVVGEYLRG